MADDIRVERQFTVQGELGLHARPASRFVAMAGHFECEIEVGRGEEWVSGRSILSILSLAAGPGASLRIRAVGADAEAAVQTLGAMLESAAEAEP